MWILSRWVQQLQHEYAADAGGFRGRLNSVEQMLSDHGVDTTSLVTSIPLTEEQPLQLQRRKTTQHF